VGKTTFLLSFFSPQKQKDKLNVDWWILMSYLFEDKILKKLFLHLEAFKAGQKNVHTTTSCTKSGIQLDSDLQGSSKLTLLADHHSFIISWMVFVDEERQ